MANTDNIRFNPKHSNGKMAVIGKELLATSRKKAALRNARAESENWAKESNKHAPSVYRNKPDYRHEQRAYNLHCRRAASCIPAINSQLSEEEADSTFLNTCANFFSTAENLGIMVHNLGEKANTYNDKIKSWNDMGLYDVLAAFRTYDYQLSPRVNQLAAEVHNFELKLAKLIEQGNNLYLTEEINELMEHLNHLFKQVEEVEESTHLLGFDLCQVEIAVEHLKHTLAGK